MSERHATRARLALIELRTRYARMAVEADTADKKTIEMIDRLYRAAEALPIDEDDYERALQRALLLDLDEFAGFRPSIETARELEAAADEADRNTLAGHAARRPNPSSERLIEIAADQILDAAGRRDPAASDEPEQLRLLAVRAVKAWLERRGKLDAFNDLALALRLSPVTRLENLARYHRDQPSQTHLRSKTADPNRIKTIADRDPPDDGPPARKAIPPINRSRR